MSVAELEAHQLQQLEAPAGGLWHDAWYRLRRNPGAMIGAGLVLVFVVAAIGAPWIAPHDPSNDVFVVNGILKPEPPSTDHLLGLDTQGRDVFSRIVYGARYTLFIGVVSVGIGLSIGLLLGSFAGYVGGFGDSGVMRLMDIMLAIPGLLFAIGIVAMLALRRRPDAGLMASGRR